jgi:hypothetical protein
MSFLATTAMEKLQAIPRQVWLDLLIAIACIVIVVFIVRKIRQMNKVLLVVLVSMIFALLGFNWIYERNEPAFLTPYIDKVAPFFPTKGKVPVAPKF